MEADKHKSFALYKYLQVIKEFFFKNDNQSK